MIRLYIKWLLNLIASNLRSVSYWMFTCLLTAGFILSGQAGRQYEKTTNVLVYYSPEDGPAKYCMSYLEDKGPDVYAYEKISDSDVLIAMVERSEASCGIVFESDGKISLYQSPGSVDGYVLKEILYPALAMYGSGSGLGEYVRQELGTGMSDNDTDDAVSYIGSRYEDILNGTDIRLYEVALADIRTDEGDTAGEEDAAGTVVKLIFPVVFFTVMGLIWYDTLGTDRDFYRRFSRSFRRMLILGNIAATAVMSTVTAGLFYQILHLYNLEHVF